MPSNRRSSASKAVAVALRRAPVPATLPSMPPFEARGFYSPTSTHYGPVSRSMYHSIILLHRACYSPTRATYGPTVRLALRLNAAVRGGGGVGNGDTTEQELQQQGAAAARKQIDFYFGDENYPSDKHILKLANKKGGGGCGGGEGWVPLKAVLGFPKMKKLKISKWPRAVAYALRISDQVEVSADSRYLRRRGEGQHIPLPAKMVKEYTASWRCSLLVENLDLPRAQAESPDAIVTRCSGPNFTCVRARIVDPKDLPEDLKAFMSSTKGGGGSSGGGGGGGGEVGGGPPPKRKPAALKGRRKCVVVEYDSAEAAEIALDALHDGENWRGLHCTLLWDRVTPKQAVQRAEEKEEKRRRKEVPVEPLKVTRPRLQLTQLTENDACAAAAAGGDEMAVVTPPMLVHKIENRTRDPYGPEAAVEGEGKVLLWNLAYMERRRPGSIKASEEAPAAVVVEKERDNNGAVGEGEEDGGGTDVDGTTQ